MRRHQSFVSWLTDHNVCPADYVAAPLDLLAMTLACWLQVAAHSAVPLSPETQRLLLGAATDWVARA